MNYDFIEEDENIVEVGERGKLTLIFSLIECIIYILAVILILREILLIILGITINIKYTYKDIMMEVILLIIYSIIIIPSVYNCFFNNVILTNKSIYIKQWNKVIKYKLQEVEDINVHEVIINCDLVVYIKNGKRYLISYLNEQSAYSIEEEFKSLMKDLRVT